jgi:hypothetical protein
MALWNFRILRRYNWIISLGYNATLSCSKRSQSRRPQFIVSRSVCLSVSQCISKLNNRMSVKQLGIELLWNLQSRASLSQNCVPEQFHLCRIATKACRSIRGEGTFRLLLCFELTLREDWAALGFESNLRNVGYSCNKYLALQAINWGSLKWWRHFRNLVSVVFMATGTIQLNASSSTASK